MESRHIGSLASYPKGSHAMSGLGMFSQNCQEQRKLHMRNVTPKLNLIGSSLLRKKSFDAQRKKQKQWMNHAKQRRDSILPADPVDLRLTVLKTPAEKRTRCPSDRGLRGQPNCRCDGGRSQPGGRGPDAVQVIAVVRHRQVPLPTLQELEAT